MSDVKSKFIFDEADQKFTIGYVQDCTAIVENNKRLQTEQQRTDGFEHYATIPNGKILEWLTQEWNRGNPIQYNSKEWWDLVDRKLEDPDNKYLRTDCRNSWIGWK